MNSDFIIITDTREQKPFTFQNIKPEPPATIRKGLKTGDYSIVGFEDKIVCERKEIGDLFNSVGKHRKRFEAEMERLATFDYAALVVESDIKTWFMNPPSRSKMSPRSVFRSLIAFSQRYGVHLWDMWNREAAERVTYLILKRYFDDCVKNVDRLK